MFNLGEPLICSRCKKPRTPDDFRESTPGHKRTVCKRCEYNRDNERYAEAKQAPVQPRPQRTHNKPAPYPEGYPQPARSRYDRGDGHY